MTESEWLGGADPRPMLVFLKGKASDRKLRLFGCSCCRRVWRALPTDASRAAVAVAEQFADKLAKRKDLNNAYLACGGDTSPSRYDAGASVVKVSLQWAAFWASHNARILAAGTEPFPASEIPAHNAATELEGRDQGRLLHDLFGNPFRPASLNPAWLTPTVAQLAEAAYEERVLPSGELDPARLAVLADALEEAGCTNTAILGHLRSPGPHVRGCWPVDLLLGKE
jgi:hypothetical protein